MRYKIRKERNGAYLFSQKDGKVEFLQESAFNTLKKAGNCRVIYPAVAMSRVPKDCFSAPSKVYIELTRRCTLRCKTCYNAAGTAFDDELSYQEICRVLDDLEKAGSFEIRFTGGEPTSREDFFEIAAYAKKLGFFVSIGTNGIWDKKTLEKIAESEIDMVIISLEGPKEVNDHIRGEGSYDKAVRSLAYLAEKSSKTLRINTTIAKYNVGCIEHIVRLADKLGIPVINTMPIRFNGRSAIFLKDQLLSPEEYYSFIKKIEKLRKTCKASIQTYFDILGERSRWLENQTSLVNKQTCAAGVEACVISPTGDVYGCAASDPSTMSEQERDMFVAGNLRDRQIMDIWFDSSRWTIYRDFVKNKSKSCLGCEFYTKKCFGNCFVSSYFAYGKLNAEDPYCFAHMLKDCEVHKNAG